jgi:predicted nucleic acid-binding protein
MVVLGTNVVVLDTNHLSDLARDPSSSVTSRVIRCLQSGDAILAVPFLVLLELSEPKFRSFGEVKALLSELPHVLANPDENVRDEEMAFVCAQVIGQVRRRPRVWARDTSEWGYHHGPAGGNAVNLLDAFRDLNAERAALHNTAAKGARESMMKADAALIREPLLPLTLALQRHLDFQRLRHARYAEGLSAQDVIRLAGGKEAFPGYQMHESLVGARLGDAGQKSTKNDVYDEYIAFYAPYAAVTALDRRMLHRARTAKLPAVSRMTYRLSEVPEILQRVISGELSFVPSAF